MKVLYDHQMFSMQKYGGITRYFSDLIFDLPLGYEGELPILYSENHYLREKEDVVIRKFSDILPFRLKRLYYYHRNTILSNQAMKKNEFNLFHPTYYDPYFIKKIKKPFVITVHDMNHEKFPDLFLTYDNTSENKRLLAKEAAHIIAVSQNTKKDLVELFGISPNKITVVYHGYKQHCKSAEALFENYLLFVGERKGYKNFWNFIKAMVPLLNKYKDLKIVCTGNPFSREELEQLNQIKLIDRVIQKSVSDSELASLYRYALAFVYPSIYEGFGIPILEAFQNDCPVCLSKASCFPEIAENAAVYFDPSDLDSITEAVRKVLENKSLADDLRDAGRIRLKDFSIDLMVKNTCEVYNKYAF